MNVLAMKKELDNPTEVEIKQYLKEIYAVVQDIWDNLEQLRNIWNLQKEE